MTRLSFAVLAVCLASAPALLQGAPSVVGVETIVDSGDPSNRYDIVFVGDAYTADQIEDYRRDVRAATDTFFAVEPFASYRAYINIHRIDVVSNESGVRGVGEPEKDTAFKTREGDFIRLRGDRGAVNDVVADFAPDADAIVCLSRDARGGTSFGKICFAGAARVSAGSDIVTHELGHTIAGLADEYSQSGAEIPPFLLKAGEFIGRPLARLAGFKFQNATARTGRRSIPWRHWIEDSTPLPTPLGSGEVGLFEGAFYLDENFYRPEETCLMREGRDFCAVCKEALILALEEEVVPFSVRHGEESGGARLTLNSFAPDRVRARWFLRKTEVARGVSELFLKPSDLTRSKVELRLEVQDGNRAVRRDDRRELVEAFTWTLRRRSGAVAVEAAKRRKRGGFFLSRWLRSLFSPLRGDWPKLRDPRADPSDVIPGTDPRAP